MHGRTIALVILGTLAPGAAAAAAAPPAPVTLGTTVTAPDAPGSALACGGGAPRCTTVARSAPGATAAAPADGVVVRWRVRSARTLTVRLRTVRRLPDGTYEATGSGPGVQVPGDAAVHAFADRVPIAAGGLLALDGTGVPNAYTTGAGAYEVVRYGASAITFDDGQTRPGAGLQTGTLQLAADVEPDADHDGRGDLTQDRADLQLTGTAPAEVGALEGFTQRYTVRNAGPDAALDVRVALSGADSGVVPSGAPGCADAPAPGAGVVCALGTLAPGATATVSPGFLIPTIFPPPSRPYTSTAVATSSTTDPAPGDTTASLATFVDPYVSPAPPPACANRQRGTRDDDVLLGTPFGDRLVGDAGSDLERGLGGDDCLLGGAGADVLDGGDGADRLDGASGDDRMAGGPGDDRLVAGRGNDRLSGGPGDDTLLPGPGRDRVLAGGGADTVGARDGTRDVVDCGAGRDTVRADRRDHLIGCEKVTRR
ncbi:hypothetical protein [Baekduia soli]|uniref:hypothetical protein n=1 Tax=Baekduia soli TaxID=496014 RepID=UPI001E3CBA8F|nr:hypothetical protein [Baekduia soli]